MPGQFTPLPADLPENWEPGQIVSPDGTDVGLTAQHGYNYLNKAVNDAQLAVNDTRLAVDDAFEEIGELKQEVSTSGALVRTYPAGEDLKAGDLVKLADGSYVSALTWDAKAVPKYFGLSYPASSSCLFTSTHNGNFLLLVSRVDPSQSNTRQLVLFEVPPGETDLSKCEFAVLAQYTDSNGNNYYSSADILKVSEGEYIISASARNGASNSYYLVVAHVRYAEDGKLDVVSTAVSDRSYYDSYRPSIGKNMSPDPDAPVYPIDFDGRLFLYSPSSPASLPVINSTLHSTALRYEICTIPIKPYYLAMLLRDTASPSSVAKIEFVTYDPSTENLTKTDVHHLYDNVRSVTYSEKLGGIFLCGRSLNTAKLGVYFLKINSSSGLIDSAANVTSEVDHITDVFDAYTGEKKYWIALHQYSGGNTSYTPKQSAVVVDLSRLSVSLPASIPYYLYPGMYGAATINEAGNLNIFGFSSGRERLDLFFKDNALYTSVYADSAEAIALSDAQKGASVEAVFSGTVPAPWAKQGDVFKARSSVYASAPFDALLEVFPKDRPFNPVMGSYIGTGEKALAASPFILNLGFKANMLIIYSSVPEEKSSSGHLSYCFFLRPAMAGLVFRVYTYTSSFDDSSALCKWNDDSIEFWTTSTTANYNLPTELGAIYNYIAI